MIIQDTRRGPVRIVLEVYGGALALFSPAQRNRAKKIAATSGGNQWLFKWLPLRFTGYAYALGYHVGQKWLNKKKRYGVTLPFVGLTPRGGGPAAPGYSQINGAKMSDAVNAAYASASNNGEVINLSVPYGHAIRSEHSEAFKTLPYREIKDVADAMAATLGYIISGSATRKTRKGVIRSRLGAEHAKPRAPRKAKAKTS